MSRDPMERAIELAPERHRAILHGGERRAELVLALRPQPHLTPAHLAGLGDALRGIGVAPEGLAPVGLLDEAWRAGFVPDLRCPWGRGGDRLWCQEPWAQVGRHFRFRGRDALPGDEWVWQPAHRMPRAAARLVLKIDEVGIGTDAAGALAWVLGVEVWR